jgi:acetyltransferase-like isoleucine patch superfamily enzyme
MSSQHFSHRGGSSNRDTIVLDGISIGSDCLIAAGAVVTRGIPDGTRAMGVPARAMPART